MVITITKTHITEWTLYISFDNMDLYITELKGLNIQLVFTTNRTHPQQAENSEIAPDMYL